MCKHTVTLNLPPDCEDAFAIRLKYQGNAPDYREHAVISGLTGKVLKTRQSQFEALWQSLLGPTANPREATLTTAGGLRLPNPLRALPAILDQYTHVRVATIHGDLNLNNVLVEAETGAVHLIDIAEARRDHVLHDFLRLETEVVTHILPEILRQHDLEPGPTLHHFYQHLHCATFEREQLTAHEIAPELQKPFEALCAIRRATCRHLYDGRPCEYYQGLLLYLTGALKFANLGDPATHHLPKRTALWVAATVAELLESASVCQPMALPEPETRPPHAVLVDYRPDVFIRRQSDHRFIPASYGLSLYRGDIVGTCDNAEAKVQCLPGPHIRIPPERNQRIDCEHPPRDRVLAELELQQEALLPPLVNEFSMNASLTPHPPLLLAPRNSRIRTPRPDFRWRAAAGARGYRLTLRMPEGQSWHRETDATELVYPADAPELAPGSSNTVILEALGTGLPTESAYLEVLDAPRAAEVRAAEEAIRARNLSEITERYLLALRYREWGLWADAIRQLERVTQREAASPIPWLHLGELYLRIGLADAAQRCYDAALPLIPEEIPGLRAVAHTGLACAHAAQGREAPAHAHLEALASGEYAPVAWHLRRKLAQPTHAQTAPIADFAAAVRSLAVAIAAPLAAEIHRISDDFLARLQSIAIPDLQLVTTGAWQPLDAASERLAAREILAATHVTTRALLATLTEVDIEQQAQTGELFYTLERRARSIAQERLGLPPDRATDFARQYADRLGHDPALLCALLAQEDVG